MRRWRDRRRARILAKYIVRNQVLPQMRAEELRERGVDIETTTGYTGSDQLDGMVDVSCISCGRTAQVPAEKAPPGKAAMCAACVIRREFPLGR